MKPIKPMTIKSVMTKAAVFTDKEVDIMLLRGAIILDGIRQYEDAPVIPNQQLRYEKNPVMEYIPVTEDMEPDFQKRWDMNWRQIRAIDELAKEKGSLLYRYISEPFADGQAVYQIIRVNKKTVRIRLCVGIGDDWLIPYWGEETTIRIDYASRSVNGRDYLHDFFSKKSANAQ